MRFFPYGLMVLPQEPWTILQKLQHQEWEAFFWRLLLSGCPRDSQNIIIYCYYPWWRRYFLWPQNLELSSGSDLKASSLRNSFHLTRRQRASFQRREAAHSPIQLCLWKHQPARTATLRYNIHTYLDGDQQHFHRTWCQINRRETEVWVIRLSSQNKDLW